MASSDPVSTIKLGAVRSSILRVRQAALVVVAIGLTGGAITTVVTLARDVTAKHEAQLVLAGVQTEFNQHQVLPMSSMLPGGSVAISRRLMASSEQRIQLQLAGLRSSAPMAQMREITAPLLENFATNRRTQALIARRANDVKAGRFPVGMIEMIDLAARSRTAATRGITRGREHYANSARTALRLVIGGSVTAIVLLLAAFLFFYLRASRTRNTALRLATEKELLAHTDALTGLRNRRALTGDLAACLSEADAPGRVLVLMDLDGFKQYNDSFGHPAGDALLARLAGRLEVTMAGIGTAYRMGGDEFCVLAEAGGDDGGEAISRLAAAALSETGEAFSIGCSYGRVLLPEEAGLPALALGLADQRMYSQKGLGRPSAGRQSADVLLQVLGEQSGELGGHMSDVARLAQSTAQRLDLSEAEVTNVGLAAELHDVGKAAIPASILEKPGKLDEHEWTFMRRHTLIGERIVLAAPSLAHVAPLVRSSHERIDGRGYPDGLRGDEIPLGSRLIAVCDAFDAMVTDRPYSEARPVLEALAELHRCAGTQFDAKIVLVFAAMLSEQRKLS